MGGAMSVVLCREETGGQRGALAGRGRRAVRTVPVGQVRLHHANDSNIAETTVGLTRLSQV